MKELKFLLLCGMALLFGASSSQGDHRALYSAPLYGITFFRDELIRIDPGTGQAQLISKLSEPVSGYGLASRYGRLYSFNPTMGEVIEIDPLSGIVESKISVGLTNVQGEGDIAFRSDGIAFVSVAFENGITPANNVYAIDVLAGTSRRVGPCQFPYDALAFDTNDVLYALAQAQGTLYIINQTNGSGTAVGSLGIDMNSPFAGMSFAPDGSLYAAVDDRLFRINKETGAATAVSTNVPWTGFSSISGVAFESGPASQELLGISFFTGQLVSVNAQTGLATLFGADQSMNASTNTNQVSIAPFGLATRSNRLYTFDGNTSRILELDPASGRPINTNNIQVQGLQGEGDLAFRPGDGLGFLSVALNSQASPVNALIAFDLNAGTSTVIGNTPFPLDGLAFNSEGELYALGQAQAALYLVNQTNAELTTISTNLGVEMNSPFAALTFTPDQRLLAAIDDRILSINLLTGTATPLDTNVLTSGFSSISGLASVPVRRLGITVEGSRVVVFGTGPSSIIESSTNVLGPYAPVAGEGELLVISNSAPKEFFRLRRP